MHLEAVGGAVSGSRSRVVEQGWTVTAARKAAGVSVR